MLVGSVVLIQKLNLLCVAGQLYLSFGVNLKSDSDVSNFDVSL